jgi:hypothetical protein
MSLRRSLHLVLMLALSLVAGSAAGTTGPSGRTLTDPIRSSQQTLVGWGDRSHWLQPWRGYLDTVSARRLVDGLGIVFNPAPSEAEEVARKVAAAGFRRARVEIGWCSVADSSEERLDDLGRIRTLLSALRRNRLRPLILLNAHHGCPGPLRRLSVRVVSPARAGDRELVLDAASAAKVVPYRTGLDSTTTYKAAAYLFTQVSGERVRLARPLAGDLRPGTYEASTLRYQPFTRPGTPEFEQTIEGWVRYVALVTGEVKRILGGNRFDVEVWNELSFASDFLDAGTYYNPPVEPSAPRATQREILERTVAYVRDPKNDLSGVGIGDGFSNTRPWEAGSTSPPGLTAIDKHPYPPRRTFPADARFNGIRPLDALGRPDGSKDGAGRWRDAFVPSYTAFFPEYYLTAIQTENVIRELSPITTDVDGTPHGRRTHPPGSPPPQVWLTEAGMDPSGIPAPVLPRFQAKGALRWTTAWLNKGAAAVFFYAAASPGWGLVDRNDPDGGPALRALGRLTRTLQRGAAPIRTRRSIRLAAVSEKHDRRQFDGDGTPGHPPLYDRDVVAFFPYQVSNRRVVISTYVMTRDLTRSYRPSLSGSDPRRYDMPPEWFRLTIDGTTGLGRRVSVSDPLLGRATGMRVVARNRDRLVVDVALTDSPRLLVLS